MRSSDATGNKATSKYDRQAPSDATPALLQKLIANYLQPQPTQI